MALYVQLPTIVKREDYMIAFPGATSVQLHFSDVKLVMGDKLIRAVTTAKELAEKCLTPVLFGLEGENLSTTSYYAVRLEQIADRYLIRIYKV